MKVVSNSGPLMALAKIGQIGLLYPVYGVVLIPNAVYEETVFSGLVRGEADAVNIEMALRRKQLKVITQAENKLSKKVEALSLDRGEKHAIQLAISEKADLILLDDMQARKEAKALELPVKGTLGIFVDAVRQSVLELADIDVIFDAILKRDDIWIAEELVHRVWEGLNNQFNTGKK